MSHTFTDTPITRAEVTKLLAGVLLAAGDRVRVTRGGYRGDTGTVLERRGESVVVKLDTLSLYYGSERNLERE